MMPVFKESHTSFTSKSGNTRVDIFRRKKQVSEHEKIKREQKCLGAALLIVGIGGCFIFREDCGGFLFASLIGIARLVCD